MVSEFQTALCCGKSCISHWSNQQIALHDSQRTASDPSFQESPGEPNWSRVDDKASMASERDRPLCVETSSSRHSQAPAFVARLVPFFQQKPTVRNPQLVRHRRRPADITLSAHQAWTARGLLKALCPAISFKTDQGFFSACIAATCVSGTASLPKVM